MEVQQRPTHNVDDDIVRNAFAKRLKNVRCSQAINSLGLRLGLLGLLCIRLSTFSTGALRFVSSQDRIDAEHKDLQLAYFKAWRRGVTYCSLQVGTVPRLIWRRSRQSMPLSPKLTWFFNVFHVFFRTFLQLLNSDSFIRRLRFARARKMEPVPIDSQHRPHFWQLSL